MAKQLFSNNATTTISGAILAAATTITLRSGTGGVFNAPTGGNWELATLTNREEVEIVKITARSGDVLTVVRGQEGTTAKDWKNRTIISGFITKATLEQLQTKASADDAISINGANVSVPYAVGIGSTATVSGQGSVGIGYGTTVSGEDSIGLGISCNASGLHSIALGHTAAASASSTIAIGNNAAADATQGIAIGDSAHSSGNTGIAIGSSAVVTSGVALGVEANADNNGVSVGTTSHSINGVAVGELATADAQWAVAIGKSTNVESTGILGVAIGAQASVTGQYGLAIGVSASAADSFCIALGAGAINSKPNTNIIHGISLIRGADAGIAIELEHCGSEGYIFSNVVDLKTAVDNVSSVTLPTGTAFFPTEVGVIVTSASGVTGQPNVSFGITGDTVALLASTATTKSVDKGKDKFTPISGDGVTSLTASVKTGAAATTLNGRFYWKGILIEDS